MKSYYNIWITTVLILICLPVISGCDDQGSMMGEQEIQPGERPNILWLVSEDNSPETISIYGDPAAQTPNIDRLAETGLVYTNANSNAPVCSVARSVLLSGMHAPSTGLHHHRTRTAVPVQLENIFYPRLLQESGYYTTNNAKTDYNVPGPHDRFWDESGNEAHYENREEGQPFFAVFNNEIPHEGQMFLDVMAEDPETNPDDITMPDYHPDIPEIRRSWAHYYDLNRQMDEWVGRMVEELEEHGLREDTIIMYYSDHGGVLPRSKRTLYHTGTSVALVVHIPEKWQHLIDEVPGTKIDRLVNFVDFAPTIMSLTGVGIPSEYQGSAFLGRQTEEAEKTTFMYRDRMDQNIDMQRGVFDGRYRYIRNFMPHRPNGQFHNYPFNMVAMQAWYHEWAEGRTNSIQSRYWLPQEPFELYDFQNDPWEVDNLAGDPNFADKVYELRNELNQYLIEIRDAGFIPFDMMEEFSGDSTLYQYTQSDEYPIERLIEIAGIASSRNPAKVTDLKNAMRDEYAPVRFWGAIGAVVLGYEARTTESELIELLDDDYGSIRATAAEALGRMGKQDLAIESLYDQLDSNRNDELLYSLNALAHLDVDEKFHERLLEKIQPIALDEDLILEGDIFEHSRRIAQYLYLKWTRDEYPPIF
ncbi:MAG: sulfatase-like hydrolase/transferase [Balneolaceae bacterium]|nr:sulfatase-like hydrolase/transferase [Balneolaceae bacterium]